MSQPGFSSGPAGEPDWVLAFDVGGTRIKAGLVDWAGRVCDLRSTETPLRAGGIGLSDRLAELARDLCPAGPPAAVGLAFPGLVDVSGELLALPGKHDGFAGRNLTAWLAELFGSGEHLVVNDALAYGVGEALAGAGLGHRRVVVATIGTGVGVCACEDGTPLGSGPLGGGVLGGQIPIASPDSGPTDSNGQRGTIEALCSVGRLAADANRAGYPDIPSLAQAVTAGEAAAGQVLAGYQQDLLAALTAFAQAYGPSAIVVGGGPVGSGWLLAGLAERLTGRLWPGHQVALRPAALGDAAALAGLGLLVGRRAGR